MKICPLCNNEHEKNGNFCSRKCANSRSHSKETKEKMRQTALNILKENPLIYSTSKTYVERVNTLCECGNIFEHIITQKRKFCSIKCSNMYNTSGGYREGSGRSNNGYYKGIFCGSTYELVWVIYNLDHNIQFERFEGCIQSDDKKLKYFPDFIIDNCIYEMKGFHTEAVDRKTNLALSKGYDIFVLYKEDLKEQFEWVKKNYTYKYLHELYDDFKPKYTYTCNYCENDFNSENKKKIKISYCSRSCAMKGNKYRSEFDSP